MITTLNLTKYYNQLAIFHKLSLHIVSGHCLHVCGQNGSGKSTLLGILAGTIQPSFGSYKLHSAPCLINQKDGLKDGLTVRDHLVFWSALFNAPLPVTEILQVLKLKHCADWPVNVLSLGQRKRVHLCQLLCANAQIWLLDEPYLGLDLQGVELLNNLMIQHIKNNGCIVLAHHNGTQQIPGSVLQLNKYYYAPC